LLDPHLSSTDRAVAAAFGAMLLHLQIVPRRIALNVIALGLFGIALGFAVATLKTALIGHPVLRFPASGVTVTGFAELREESQHTDRFVLRVDRIDGGRIEEPPRRVRLSVKRGMAPAAGSFAPRIPCRSQRVFPESLSPSLS
jgi:competence protein ComEC